MKLERLVIEGREETLAVDLHPGLTVAINEQPESRSRFVDDLLGSLGGDRDGLHVELTHRNGHYLVVFRPAGAMHRVVDADVGQDVTAYFRAPSGRVNVLGGSGVDETTALPLMRLGAADIDAAADTGTDDHRMARRLAAADQEQLWSTAEQMVAAESRLNAATADIARTSLAAPAESANGSSGPPRSGAVEEARARQLANEARKQVELAATAHRGVLRLGFIVAGACAAIALLLVAFSRWLDDNNWTAKALFILAAVALVLALTDRRHLWAAQRRERRIREALSPPTLLAVESADRPLADDRARNAVLVAAAECDVLTSRWRMLSGGVPLRWALANRAAVEQLVARRRPSNGQALLQPGEMPFGEGQLAEASALLLERLAQLRDVGDYHEALPLVLDEPFTALPAADRLQLLDRLARVVGGQQVVLVTGDATTIAWATPRAQTGQLNLLRVGHATPVAEPQPSVD